jgi:hypothetical protein
MLIRELRDDCTSVVLPYVALSLVLIVGMAALVLGGTADKRAEPIAKWR